MNYYQFHIADWALHTAHLSLVEEAIYRRLLDYYYDTEQPIPQKTDWVFRRLRLAGNEETAALILEEFFVLRDDGWHNLRADREIEEYNRKAETARTNGKRGGRPKKQKQEKQPLTDSEEPEKTQSVSGGMQGETGSKANHKPLTINQEPIINTPQSPPGGEASEPDDLDILFDRFWEAYPRKADKAKARKAWQKLKPDADLVDKIVTNIDNRLALGDWCTKSAPQFIPLPTTYLNGKRWNDDPIPNRAKPALQAVGGGARPAQQTGFIEKHTDKTWADGL